MAHRSTRRSWLRAFRPALCVLLTLASAVPALAQTDLSGWWARQSQNDNGYANEPVDLIGIPVSADAVLTEYYDLTKNGNDTVLTVTTIVDDPTYLRTRRLIAYPFKKEANGDKWDPTPCSARW